MNNNKGPLIVLLFVGVIAIVGVAAFLVTRLLPGGNTTTTVELNYLGLWDEPVVYEELIKEYEASHPNVKIKYARQTFKNQNALTYKGAYQTDIEDRLKSNTVDIVRVHQAWLPKLASKITAAPSDILSGAKAREIYYPAITESLVTTTNQVVAAPQIIDGMVLFYNVEILKKAGITDPETATKDWDETLKTAQKLTQKNTNGTLKVAGINMGSVANIRSSFEILLTMMTQAAIPVVSVKDAATGTLQASFASEEAAAAVNRYYEFSKLGTWSSRMEDDLQEFANGRLALMIAPSWRAIDLVAMNKDLQFATIPLPTLPGANSNVPQFIASYWVDVVSKESKSPREAWAFLAWLGEPAQLRRIYAAQLKQRLIGNPYPRIDMAAEQTEAPYIGAVVKMAPRMKSWPLYDYGVWEEVFRKGFLAFEDKGGVTQNDLEEMQVEINKITLKRL